MDLSLIETLRWDSGFVRLERHLARLVRSAAALGLPGAAKAEDALVAALPPTIKVASERRSGLLPISPLEGEVPGRAEGGEPHPLRIRLELFADGRIDVQTAPFIPLAPGTIWRLKFAATHLASTDPLLRHKTSQRALYTQARGEFPASEADEVILLNERGEICEGTITSLFLDDGSGILKTPPLAAGLLAGVLREELLETGRAVEAVLRPHDLSGGTVHVGNSLRGLIRGTLA